MQSAPSLQRVQPNQVHLVVARYRESLEWLSSLDNPRTIYDKSGEKPAQGEVLPNVGREAHTMAHYIVQHYQNLPERICFLQGDPWPHLGAPLAQILADPAPLVFGKGTSIDNANGYPAHPGLPVRELYLELFNDQREAFPYSSWAQYVVGRERILFRPRRFYELLENLLSYDVKAWEAWAIERIWPVVFDGTTPDYFQAAREIPQLSWYAGDEAIGPVQRDEATILFAITRLIRPRVALEFGAARGHSLRCFLEATPDTVVYSFDIHRDPRMDRHLRKYRARLKFVQKSQTDLVPDCLDPIHRDAVDLVFFDASHILESNQVTYARLGPLITPDTLLLVHDTGLWERAHMSKVHLDWKGEWVTPGRKAHQPAERLFVRWLTDNHGWSRVDLGSRRTLRHGLTILQRV